MSFSIEAQAQRYKNNFVPYSSVGLGVGSASYYGDMAPYGRVFASTFRMMRWNVSGEYTRHFTPNFAARASLTWARIAGDDFTMNKSGQKINQGHFIRNLHFRNDVKEFALVGIYKLIPDSRSYDRRGQYGPYLFAGIAAFAHNPKARLPYDQLTDEKGRWVALQPLGTEGQGNQDYAKPYSLVQFAVPIGVGVRYKINQRIDVAAELGFRFTSTDYLDDVSKGYPDPSVFNTPDNNNTGQSASNAQNMSQRVFEYVPARKGAGDRTALLQQYLGLTESDDPMGYLRANPDLYETRGSSGRRGDNYLLGTIKINYILGSPVKCPPLK